MTTTRPASGNAARSLAAIVGYLVLVELASGILQGYYTPIYPQIADHLSIHEGDINWFEAAQLIVSALCIPLLARLGDLVGHKRVLLGGVRRRVVPGGTCADGGAEARLQRRAHGDRPRLTPGGLARLRASPAPDRTSIRGDA